jgi:hypothetical protein
VRPVSPLYTLWLSPICFFLSKILGVQFSETTRLAVIRLEIAIETALMCLDASSISCNAQEGEALHVRHACLAVLGMISAVIRAPLLLLERHIRVLLKLNA